eukprot:gene3259-5702_t
MSETEKQNYEARSKETKEEDVQVKIPEFLKQFSCECYSEIEFHPDSKSKCSKCQRQFNFVDVKNLVMAYDWLENANSIPSIFHEIINSETFEDFNQFSNEFILAPIYKKDEESKKEEYDQFKSCLSIIAREISLNQIIDSFFDKVTSFYFSVREYFQKEAISLLYFTKEYFNFGVRTEMTSKSFKPSFSNGDNIYHFPLEESTDEIFEFGKLNSPNDEESTFKVKSHIDEDNFEFDYSDEKAPFSRSILKQDVLNDDDDELFKSKSQNDEESIFKVKSPINEDNFEFDSSEKVPFSTISRGRLKPKDFFTDDKLFGSNEFPTKKSVTHEYCIGKIDKLPQITVNKIRITYPSDELLIKKIFKDGSSFTEENVKIHSHDFDVTSKDSKILEIVSKYMKPNEFDSKHCGDNEKPFELKFSKLKLLENEEIIEFGNDDEFGYLYIFLPSFSGANDLKIVNSNQNIDFDFSLHENDSLDCKWIAFEKNSKLKYNVKSFGNQIALVYMIKVNPNWKKDKKLQYPNEMNYKSPIPSLLNLLEFHHQTFHIFLNDTDYDGRNLNPDDYWIVSKISNCEDWIFEINQVKYDFQQSEMILNDKILDDNQMTNIDFGEYKTHLSVITLKLKTKLTVVYFKDLKFSFQ